MINYLKEMLSTLKKIESHLSELRECIGTEYNKDHGDQKAIRTADKEPDQG